MHARRLSRRPNAEQKQLLIRSVAIFSTLFLFIIICTFIAGKWIDEKRSSVFTHSDPEQMAGDATQIPKQELDYQFKSEITTVLLIGVDQDLLENKPILNARKGGQADFLALLVLDSANKTVTRLQIDRDTITEITVLGILGNKTGTQQLQICLSHGYGDGREESCELTVMAVEQFLDGIQVDEYVAINLNGIGALNDVLGGVTVPIKDDFSFYDATMIAGTEMKLNAQQVEYYIRKRINIGDGTNQQRMQRQTVFIKMAAEQASVLLKQDMTYVDSLFDALEPYMTTSMNRGRMINLINNVTEYRYIAEPITIDGEYRKGSDGFVEFYADEEALHQLVIQTFYEPVS